MKFRWSVLPTQPLLAGQLAKDLNLLPLLAQCLLNRDLCAPDGICRFLQPRLKNLSDPFLLPNMSAAVERLFRSRQADEPVVIFGDYDVDGVSSTALLFEVLSSLHWNVCYYLPHRIEEGYGLSRQALENCLNKHPAKVLLAVDCGSSAVESIQLLQERGIDVLILDHHQVSSPAPAALALVNPQLNSKTQLCSSSSTDDGDCGNGAGSAFTELCSVGLAFKLAHALIKHGREIGLPGASEFDLRPLLDLVALGTIADLVPLTGENRILVSAGLERLNTTRRPGLIALKQVTKCSTPLTAFEVAFQLAPRLNAAGRLETAEASLHLILAHDLAEARPLALNLDARNRERQQLERNIAEAAVAAVRLRFKPENDFVIVEGDSQWHIGVVGIVASRVLQQFYRPTIIVGGDGAEWRGSGRSISGFDLAGALRECSDLLVRHGGHAMAAGISILPGRLDDFRVRLNEVARRFLTPDSFQPQLRLDAEVGLEEMTLLCLDQLGQLRPAGQGNPAVQFLARNLTHDRPLQRMGAQKQHVKLWPTDGATLHEAVWWGAGNESLPVGRFDLAFTPEINVYNGRRSVQLKVLDWRPTGA
jgi:single-stranded-DNA-specific exonuclease